MELADRMEKLDITRAELARRLNTSPAYVTKVLGGNANFTLASMVKLAMALRGTLHVHIAERNVITHWQDQYPSGPIVSEGELAGISSTAKIVKTSRTPDKVMYVSSWAA
jgi:transcriptional regulator with XRE-family HTH domain